MHLINFLLNRIDHYILCENKNYEIKFFCFKNSCLKKSNLEIC